MHFIKTLQRLLVSYSTDLKIVCNNNKIINSHKILFGLLHASLEEIFIQQEEFIDQTATIFLPIDSEDLKTALNFDSIEGLTNIIKNMFKGDSDLNPEPSKQVNDISKVKLESIDIEDFVSVCIDEPVEGVNFEDALPKNEESRKEIIEKEKKFVKKVKLEDILIRDVEETETLPEHKIESRRNENSLKQMAKKENKKAKEKFQYDNTIKARRHICSKCGKKFPTNSGMLRHLNFVHNKKCIQCDKCDYKTPIPDSMMKHIAHRHSIVNLTTCHECGKKVKSLNYQKHLSTHSEARRKLINCTICGKELMSKQLIHHMRMVHGERNYACDKCNYRAPNNSNLRLHLIKMHQGQELRKSQCDFCEVKTTNMPLHIKNFHPTDIIDNPTLLTPRYRTLLSSQAEN